MVLQRKQLIGMGMVGLGGLLMYGLLRWQPEGAFGFLLMLTGVLLLVLGAGMWVLTPRPAHAEPSPSLQESPSRPWISWGIALVCLGVFLAVQMYPKLPAALGLRARSIRAGEYWRFVTYGFTHQRWMHLAGNLLSLLILGTRLENQYGRLRFCMVYLLGMQGGGFAFLAFDGAGTCIGASGALYGVMGFLLSVGIADRAMMGRFLYEYLIPLALVGAAESLFSPGVSGWCHAGGFLPGLLLGLGYLLHRALSSK